MASSPPPKHRLRPQSALPPELEDIDEAWNDEGPTLVRGDSEFDRITQIPEVPSEDFARQMMSEVRTDPPPRVVSDIADEQDPFNRPTLTDPTEDPTQAARRAFHAAATPLPTQVQEINVPHPPEETPTMPSDFAAPGEFSRTVEGDTARPPPFNAFEPLHLAPPSRVPDSGLELDADAPPPPPSATRPSERPAEPPDDSLELDLELGISSARGAALALAEQTARAPVRSGQDLSRRFTSIPPPSADPIRNMKDRYAMGDFTGALSVAEKVLAEDPTNGEATRFAQSCRDVLTDMFASRIGGMDQLVTVAMGPDQIRWLSLDHRAGFLLSMVDGTSTVEELLDVSGMQPLDALRILCSLLDQQVVALRH